MRLYKLNGNHGPRSPEITGDRYGKGDRDEFKATRNSTPGIWINTDDAEISLERYKSDGKYQE